MNHNEQVFDTVTHKFVNTSGKVDDNKLIDKSSSKLTEKNEVVYGKTNNFYLPEDILLIGRPNYFRKCLRKAYSDYLHNVLKDNMIVSIMFKMALQSGEFRSLGARCGYKFSYDELMS